MLVERTLETANWVVVPELKDIGFYVGLELHSGRRKDWFAGQWNGGAMQAVAKGMSTLEAARRLDLPPELELKAARSFRARKGWETRRSKMRKVESTDRFRKLVGSEKLNESGLDVIMAGVIAAEDNPRGVFAEDLASEAKRRANTDLIGAATTTAPIEDEVYQLHRKAERLREIIREAVVAGTLAIAIITALGVAYINYQRVIDATISK